MFGAVLAVVAGCETQPLVTQIGAGSYGSAGSSSTPLSGEPAFAAEVARSRLGAPLETVSGNWTLRGVNTGSSQGCQYVSVENLNLHRTTHYSVCGGEVRERAEVAPTYPPGGDAERVRRSVIDSAWRYGQAEQQWGVYRISAARVGPPHADGCAVISTTITYDGMLVRNTEERVCH
jgi:hypothetical protein